MLMLMLVRMVVVMVVLVVMAAAVWIVAFLVFFVKFFGHQLGYHIVLVGFHGLQDLFSGDLIPGRGDDDGVAVMRAQFCYCGGHLFFAHVLGAGEDDGAVSYTHLDVYKIQGWASTGAAG